MKLKQKRLTKGADKTLLILVLVLIIFGVVAVSSASTVLSFERFGHNYYYSLRQLIFAGLGIGLIFFLSRVDYHVWKRWSRPLMLAGLLVLAAVLIPGIGFKVGPSRSWFNTGFFFIQPSEFVKLAVIFYLASWFERKKEAEANFWFGIMPPLLAAGAAISLVVLEPDPGMAAIYVIIILAMLFAAGVSPKYILALFGAAIATFWILIKAAPYRAARIVSFLNPEADPLGIGYHINQALLAIGSGGFWGYGFGLSRQKHKFLPEPIGDSIFAIMAEELGFVRIVILVVMFGLLAILGIRIASNAPDKFGMLLAVGIISWITMQAMINMAAIMNLMPLTGITLPFVSYGGSSLLALSAGIGILLNISKQRL